MVPLAPRVPCEASALLLIIIRSSEGKSLLSRSLYTDDARQGLIFKSFVITSPNGIAKSLIELFPARSRVECPRCQSDEMSAVVDDAEPDRNNIKCL